jgi:hypothetical protein
MPDPSTEEASRWRGILDALAAAREEEVLLRSALEEVNGALARGAAWRAEAEDLAARKVAAERALAASEARLADLRRRAAALEARR